MTIFFVLNHPAHYHLFKNTIKHLNNNNKLYVFIRPKDVLEELIMDEGFEYEIISSGNKRRKGISGIMASSFIGLIRKDINLVKKIQKYKPEILIGTDWAIIHAGRLTGVPSIVFSEDDTAATPENKLFYPFASTLVLPSVCDRGKWIKKRISYNGYHELAYLHPKYFEPSVELVKKELQDERPFIIVRLVSLSASHDIGKKGLSKHLLIKLIDKYKDKFNILISSEDDNLDGMDNYKFKFNPAIMHHFLAAASLVIGDSQTITAEAAILGTPSLRFNDFVGKLSYLEELEYKYGLSYGFKTSDPKKLLQKTEELLTYPGLKDEWKRRRDKMLSEKIDVTAFMIWFIRNYPSSTSIMNHNPDFQFNFV